MSDDTSAVRMRMKRHLMSWSTGAIDPGLGPGAAGDAGGAGGAGGADGAATVLLETGEALREVIARGLAGPGSLVLAPASADVAAATGASVEVQEYDGSPAEPGEELALGDDFYLQIQDYATSAYMSVIAPTLVRITGADDLAAFCADADEARATGTFPDFLVAAPVQLADIPGLGGDRRLDGPGLRLHVTADGEVSTSPAGAALGTVADGGQALASVWRERNAASTQPCAVCLGGVVDEETRAAELARRPWLGRYHAAVTAVRELHVRGMYDIQVSGFGARLNEDLTAAPDPADATDPTLPLLLWAEEQVYVCRPGYGRTFQISTEMGRLAERLLVAGSRQAAADSADADQLAVVADKFAAAGAPLTAAEAAEASEAAG